MNGRDVSASPLLNYAHDMKCLTEWRLGETGTGHLHWLASPLGLLTWKVFSWFALRPRTWRCAYQHFHSEIHVLWGSNPKAETSRCVFITKREQKREKTEVMEKASPPSLQRESTHICVLEIKTVCLSPDFVAARPGAVMAITILGILCGIFWWRMSEN